MRALLSVALVGLVLWATGVADTARAFALPAPLWLLPALLLALPQILLSALRWRMTAHALGLSLSVREAVREYALANFMNQVLPGGVAGDAARAWRHARCAGRGSAPWLAVVLERASGQIALWLITLVGLVCLPDPPRGMMAAVTGLLVLSAACLAWAALCGRAPSWLSPFVQALRAALASPAKMMRQLALSLPVVVCYLLAYLCCARALGAGQPLMLLWPLASLALLAMSLPLTMAGWGVREGAAALLWAQAGLDAAQGVAISLCYGVCVLLSSLPGALLLTRVSVRRSRSNSVSLPQR